MNNKAFFILLIFVLVGLSYFVGYYFGAANTLDSLSKNDKLYIQNDISNSNVVTQNTWQKASVENVLEDDSNKQVLTNDAAPTQLEAQNEQELTALNQLIEEGDISALLNYLLVLSASEEPDDMDLFGPTLDALQAAVKENPNNLQVLMDYFVDSDSDSRAPYYITSVLQGVDAAESELAINNLVNRLTAIGTTQANEKLLHLIASTGAHHENEEIIATVKNIALYGDENEKSRLYALDLLMPFQLNTDEKNKVVSDFSVALNQASSENKGYLLENIIRFSDKSSREQLANNYLEEDHDFATRVAILSTLHSGTVPATNQLKDKLFNIALNTNDPLHEHAKHALMYVFEIDNEQYLQLSAGKP